MTQENTTLIVETIQRTVEKKDRADISDFPCRSKDPVLPTDLNLESLAKYAFILEDYKNRIKNIINEISELKRQRRWSDILDLFHPLEEKEPLLVNYKLDFFIRQEIAFSLCQVGKFDDAIKEYEKCLILEESSFKIYAALLYTIYNRLLAIKTNKLTILPNEKKELIKKAERYFVKAIAIKPDSITIHYRYASLLKNFTENLESAAEHFKIAVSNWEGLQDDQKKKRHQEFKNYIKSLYGLACCKLELGQPKEAHYYITNCITHDSESGFILPQNKGFTLAKVLVALNDFRAASGVLLEAKNHIKNKGSIDYLLELLARIYLRLGLFEEALRTIEEIPVQKRRPYVVWTEAEILYSMGKCDKAKSILKKCAEHDRRAAHKALIKLARISFLERDYRQAMHYVNSANDFHMNTYGTPCFDALFWKVAILLRTNQVDKAKEEYSELKRLSPFNSKLRLLKYEISKISRFEYTEDEFKKEAVSNVC